MSLEDDELRELDRLLAKLVSEAKGQDDLGMKLINELSASFDDYVAHQKITITPLEETGTSSWPTRVIQWLEHQVNVLNYGPRSRDPFTRICLDELKGAGVLSRAQFRLINIYSMVSLDPDGVGLIRRPSKRAYPLATVYLMLVGMVAILAMVVACEVLSSSLVGWVIAYAMGNVLGVLLRDAYDYAWGRERAIEKFKDKMPWIRVVSV